MIEAAAVKETVEKQVETDSKKLSQSFLSKLERSLDIPKPETLREVNKISSWWKDIDDRDESDDKPEQLEKLRQEYIEGLKQNSEYPETIQDGDEIYEKISPEDTAEKRVEFNTNKDKIIKEWEEKNGKEWPRYKDDMYINSKLIRKTGDRYDAHHIHPLSLGGKNDASNVTPISAEKHFDKQGVHTPDSPYGRLEKTLQEVKIV